MKPKCICKNQPEMELSMESKTGEIWECPECAKLLYQSKVTPVQTWYRAEVTFSDQQLEVCQRHCNACNGLQPHVRAGDSPWRCLRCATEGRGNFSQKSPTGA